MTEDIKNNFDNPKINDFVLISNEIIVQAFIGKKDLIGVPYTNHLFNVASDCWEVYQQFNPLWKKNIHFKLESTAYRGQVLKSVALLHDLFEDVPEYISEAELRLKLNNEIVDNLVILTRLPNEEYFDYIDRIIASKSVIALVVKLTDLMDNMDIYRFPILKKRHLTMIVKYHKAHRMIGEVLKELCK